MKLIHTKNIKNSNRRIIDMENKKERLIYSNYNLWEDYVEMAREILYENGIEYCTEKDIWDEIYFQNSIDYEYVTKEFERFFLNEGNTWILHGNFGRWDGKHECGFIFKTWEELMRHEPMENCDYIKLYDKEGGLYLECTHHDGTNHYEIKKVTRKGEQLLEKWESNYNDERSERQIHNTIINNNFYSEFPYFVEKMYGTTK